MSQTDINILLRATDQASSVIDSAASKLSGSMAKIEDANKKVEQAGDKVKVSSRQVALAFNNIATSGMALYVAYDRVRDMQVQVDRSNLMVNTTLNSLNDAQRRYTKAVAESGAQSEKAQVAAADLSVAQERYTVACERAEVTQDNYNKTIIQSAVTVIPSLITMISSVTTVTKTWTSATEMASTALTFLQAHPIILVITAIVELVAVLAIAYQRCEAFREAVNRLSPGALSVFSSHVEVAQAAVEGLTWAQMEWLKSFDDLQKIAPSTANAINGFSDACYRARNATDDLDNSLATLTAEYENAKKAIDDQIDSLSILTVVEIGHGIESGKESERNRMIEESVRRLRAEMDGLDESYANATEEIKKKIKAQEDEKRTQELLADLTETYNLSVAKASLTLNTYGESFNEAFGAGRVQEALDVAKNFAAEFNISINDAIRTLQSFSSETTDTFSNLSDAAKEYLTGQAQDNVQKFKDCAGSKLELLKKKIENLDIFEAIRISAGNLGGAISVPNVAGGQAERLAAVQERLQIFLQRGGMAEGGIVTQPTLTWVGERGPEAIIPLDKASSLGNITIQINVTGAVDRATADYAVSQMKSALENVVVEASSVSGPSTHKRIRWGD